MRMLSRGSRRPARCSLPEVQHDMGVCGAPRTLGCTCSAPCSRLSALGSVLPCSPSHRVVALYCPPRLPFGKCTHIFYTVLCCAALRCTTLYSWQVRTRLFSANGKMTAMEIVASIWRESGVLGFFRGWTAAYSRLGPIYIFFPTVLEQALAHQLRPCAAATPPSIH